MSAPKPWRVKEPYCIHSANTQAASMCRICKDGPDLAKWIAEWDAWIADNPDSPEAMGRKAS